MSLYSFSFADTMLSLQSFFQVIPHETAVARFAAAGERAEISDFCRGIVLGMVQSVEVPAAPAPRRPVGRPRGNFDECKRRGGGVIGGGGGLYMGGGGVYQASKRLSSESWVQKPS